LRKVFCVFESGGYIHFDDMLLLVYHHRKSPGLSPTHTAENLDVTTETQWRDDRNEALLKSVLVFSPDEQGVLQHRNGFVEDWLKRGGGFYDQALEEEEVVVALEDFQQYFLEEWNAGVELFGEADFIQTMLSFKAIGLATLPRPARIAHKGGFDLQCAYYNSTETPEEAGEVLFHEAGSFWMFPPRSFDSPLPKTSLVAILTSKEQRHVNMGNAALPGETKAKLLELLHRDERDPEREEVEISATQFCKWYLKALGVSAEGGTGGVVGSAAGGGCPSYRGCRGCAVM